MTKLFVLALSTSLITASPLQEQKLTVKQPEPTSIFFKVAHSELGQQTIVCTMVAGASAVIAAAPKLKNAIKRNPLAFAAAAFVPVISWATLKLVYNIKENRKNS